MMQDMDRGVSELVEQYGSGGRFIGQPFVPTTENLEELGRRAEKLLSDLGDMKANSRAESVSMGHLVEVLETLLARLEDDRGYPFRYVTAVTGGIPAFVELDARPTDKKIEILKGRMDVIPTVLEAVCRRNSEVSARSRRMTVETLDNAASLIGRTAGTIARMWPSAKTPDLLVSMERAREACLKTTEAIGDLPPIESPVTGLTYSDLLGRVFGASARELAVRTRDDVRDLVEQMRAVAEKIRPGATPDQVLRQDLHRYLDGEEMLEDMKRYVQMTRDMCGGIVELPPDERCVVTAVPEHLQDLFPWGGYTGPEGYTGQKTGYCYINTTNSGALNRGWLMNMALHEAYPGHHAQSVCASAGPVPRTARSTALYSRASHAAEGMAHRSEDVYQDIFDDEVFSLFVLYRRLHTAVRILCELELNYYENGDESALRLYEKYMGFDGATAQGQVRLQHMWRGYMTSYFTGYRKLAEIQQSAGMGDDEFTRLIFSAGFVSLATLERLAALPETERSLVG